MMENEACRDAKDGASNDDCDDNGADSPCGHCCPWTR